MISIQKSLVYQGDISLLNTFPEFKKVDLDFSIPFYKYFVDNQKQVASRSFVTNTDLNSTVDLQSKNYAQTIATEWITSTDYRIFFYYYLINLRGKVAPEGNRIFNFPTFSQNLALEIGLNINAVYADTFWALPLIVLTGDKTLLAANNEVGRMAFIPQDIVQSDEGFKKYLTDNLFLLNNQVIQKIVNELSLMQISAQKLIEFLSLSLKSAGKELPQLVIPAFNELSVLIRENFSDASLNDVEYNKIIEIVKRDYKLLFDFPVVVPEIKPVKIMGDILFLGTEPVNFSDLSNYDLYAEYQVAEQAGAPLKNKSILYNWHNFTAVEIPNRDAAFNFSVNNNFILNAAATPKVALTLKLFDGTVLWHREFRPDDEQLGKIHIEVPLLKATAIGGSGNASELNNLNLTLKGKVIEITGKCTLKDLTVIIQAKNKKEDAVWRVVGSATTDVTGSFSIAYPMGVFELAQAIVSLTPDSAVDIPVNTDAIHVMARQTISNDFLYLLVKGIDCTHDNPADCDCHSTLGKTPRLPDQADLINSDKYSQDLGGGTCVNLTTPNRTLSERNYFAIVRTSDPDVANYELQKHTETENDGFVKVDFKLSTPKKIERTTVSLENLISWQDSPDSNANISLYQSVTVATGHLLTYKSVMKADGYSLGDLLYSLPLAPGQKKEIVVYDWKRTLQGSETQQISQRESINASIVNDRNIIDSLSGGINESLRGQSSASTSGISAGLGVGAILGPVGAVLGVSGGVSNSSSSASQNSSRNTVQAFSETLRNSVMQSASSYRELNATLIDTVAEGQQFATTTEVIANHNHCHSLTMLYFEVLRHYAVYQELAQVEECIFVPLIMTHFSQQNIHKFRDVLAASLLYRPSNTYLPSFYGRNPLLRAFDANDRVLTNWANVDYPTARYCDEPIMNVKGELAFRTHLPRPKTKYDRIKSLPIISKTISHEVFDGETAAKSTAGAILTGGLSLLFGGSSTTRTVSEQVQVRKEIFDNFMHLDANYETVPPAQCVRVYNFYPSVFTAFGNTISISGFDFFENGVNDKIQWEAIAQILGYSGYNAVFEMLDYYFNGRLIAEWDDIYNKDIAPLVFEKIIHSINIEKLGVDLTSNTRYNGGERLMYISMQGATNLKRIDFPPHIKIFSNSPSAKKLKNYVTLIVENVKITYSTAHYNGTLFSGRIQDSLLQQDTDLFIPVSADEKRNPRKEDKFIVNELLTHLNSNLEYYNKALWYNLDIDRRYLLLDGFHIQVYNDLNQPLPTPKSLASVVKNQLIGIAGNSLIFPVAAGVKVDRSYIIVVDQNVEGNHAESKISLFDHYKPLTPSPPYRISVPTRGIFAEAVQGSCDACENVKDNSSQDWEKFKTDEPTAINAVTVPTPTPTDWKAAFKDLATPIVNIQNAPAAPAPGVGLAGLSELLGKNDVFKDITGLDGNQKNAMATYLSNQENAKAFASMAKDMAMQTHNTDNADKIKTAISDAQSSGAISKDDAGKLTKQHIQQMIDGGAVDKAEAAKVEAAKPSLSEAAVKAVDQGKAVKAETTNATTGKTEKVDIGGSSSETVLAEVTGLIPKLKQENSMLCWATAATMMLSWKNKVSMSVPTALAQAGAMYVQKYNVNKGLLSSEKPAFITALNMIGEPPANYTLQKYIDWVQTYGPLWVTTDSSTATGVFSPHARILTKITGAGTPDGQGTYFTFINPATGSEQRESFTQFLSAYEQMVTDNPGDLFVQIVHFADAFSEGSSEGGAPKAPKNGELTLYGHYVWDPAIDDTTEINLLTQGKWSPSSVDFMAVTGQASSFGIGDLSALLGEIAKYPDASIKRINFFTHANSSMVGMRGKIDPTNVFFDESVDDVKIDKYIADDPTITYQSAKFTIADAKKKLAPNAMLVLYACHVGANINILKAFNRLLGIQVIGFKKEIIFCPPTQTTSPFKRTGTKIGINKPPSGCANAVDDWRGLITDPEAVKVP